MAIISISINESSEQVVAGIPRVVTLTTNISSTIFYTLDGSVPNLFSNIYTGPIYLPTDILSITLKVFASNGTDTSPIIEEEYITNILSNARLPHSSTTADPGSELHSLYPFGTNPIQPNANFLNPGDSGVNVDDPSLPVLSTGFDGYGNPTGFTNKPYTSENYNIVYSLTNAQGETGHGIGNLPATVKVETESAPPEETEQFSKLFDPRALVIFQDSTKENPNDPPQINRQFFVMEDPEKARDGAHFYNSGLDAATTGGSFVRSHYNPRDNTITYYYYDSPSNRWIISKTPYQPSGNWDGNLSGIAMSREPGSRYVLEWQPFARRVLF